MMKRLLAAAVTCALLAATAHLIYSVDPYQYFRKADRYFLESRLQLPGLAKHQDYDSIILGDSIAGNLDLPLAEAWLPGKFLNLAMEGATTYEEHLLLDTALKTGKVKKVVWALHHISLADPPGAVRPSQGLSMHLYGANSFLKTFRYIISPASLTTSLRLKYAPESLKLTNSLETYGNWHEQALKLNAYSYDSPLAAYYVTLRRDGIIDSLGQWNQARLEEARAKSQGALDIMKANIDRYILPAFAENPGVEFIIYLPPLPIVSYKYAAATGALENIFAMRVYLAEKALEHRNVTLYDFQGERNWILNLALYKDIMHYSQAVDAGLVQRLAANRHMAASVEQIDRTNQELRRLTGDFLIRPVDAEVIEWLKRAP